MALSPLLACGGSGKGTAAPDAGAAPDAAPDAAPVDPDAIVYVAPLRDGEVGSGTMADPYRDLQTAIDAAPDQATVVLLDGLHFLEPKPYTDPTCGNCNALEFRADIAATRGVRIAGKGLTLRGESLAAQIVTGAGYGVIFEDAGESRLERVTVTGGKRDGNGRATNAAVMVRTSHLVITNVDILDNDDLFDGEPDPIVGVAGVAVREGAVVDIDHTRILNTSWDGIAVYRGDPEVPGSGPVLHVDNVEVGCTRNCVNQAGRGVGIGVTWDGKATIRNSEIHHFWKGVGSFGTTEVTLENSVIRDQHGWGVIVSADSVTRVANNTIVHNGTTGLALWDGDATGTFVNNAVVKNGWNTNEWVGKRTGMWLNSTSIAPTYNLVWDNQPMNACSGGVPGGAACTPIDMSQGDNRVEPPGFPASGYQPTEGSPLIDGGDPALLDPDGSRSDIGAFGGPNANWDPPAR